MAAAALVAERRWCLTGTPIQVKFQWEVIETCWFTIMKVFVKSRFNPFFFFVFFFILSSMVDMEKFFNIFWYPIHSIGEVI